MKINVKYNYKEKRIRTYFFMSLFVFNFSNYSRIMCEAPNYMFPEIEEGTCVEFSYKDLECLIEEDNGKA